MLLHNLGCVLEGPSLPGECHRGAGGEAPVGSGDVADELVLSVNGDIWIHVINAWIVVVGVVIWCVECGATGAFVGECFTEYI